jgi:hypothetical protein
VNHGLETIPRAEFVAEYWDYNAGDHVTIVAPTDYGKTWFTNDLLAVTATPDLQAVVLATKPRDATMDRLLRQTTIRRTTTYPPSPTRRAAAGTVAGWAVWPKHTGDPDVDGPAHRAVFRRALLSDYSTRATASRRRFRITREPGPKILDVDELYNVGKLMNLNRELATLWSLGRSVGIGLWGGTQRPFDIHQLAYSQPQHLFLGYTPDRRDRTRFREIGGVSPEIIDQVTANLAWREWLYIHRKTRSMCIVAAS